MTNNKTIRCFSRHKDLIVLETRQDNTDNSALDVWSAICKLSQADSDAEAWHTGSRQKSYVFSGYDGM